MNFHYLTKTMGNANSNHFFDLKEEIKGLIEYLDDILGQEEMSFSEINNRFDVVASLTQRKFAPLNNQQNLEIYQQYISDVEDFCDFVYNIQVNHYIEQLPFFAKPNHLSAVINLADFFAMLGDFLWRFMFTRVFSKNAADSRIISITTIHLCQRSHNLFSFWFNGMKFIDKFSTLQIQDLPEFYFEVLKPVIQQQIASLGIGCERASFLPFAEQLVWCEISLLRIETTMMTNNPVIFEDIINDESSNLSLQHVVDMLDCVYAVLLEKNRWDIDSHYYRRLLHWCRLRRGFLQKNFDMFRDEEEWLKVMIEILFEAKTDGKRLPEFPLASA